MKKKALSHITTILSCVLATSMLLTGCGKSKEIILYGSEEEYGKAQLCDYSNLSATKNVYEITEDMISEQIEAKLYDNIDFKQVDRPIENDDIVATTMTISSGGEVLFDFTENAENEEDRGYELTVGYEEFGEEFDQKILGAKAGDHLTFSLDYDQDFDIEEFAGKTVDFDVTISSVSIEEMPQLTEEFVKNTLEYDSIDALRQAVKEEITAQYEETSLAELKNQLLSQIIEQSTFEEYSQDMLSMYKASVEESYVAYMEMFGASTLDEIYEMFEIKPEDINEEALQMAKQMTVINQIGREQNIKVTKEEYDNIISGYVTDYEYDSKDALFADYGEENVKSWILEDKVYEYLIANATITESAVSASSEEDEIFSEEDALNSEDSVDMDEVLMSDDLLEDASDDASVQEVFDETEDGFYEEEILEEDEETDDTDDGEDVLLDDNDVEDESDAESEPEEDLAVETQ